MYKISWEIDNEEKEYHCETLDMALLYAKDLNVFVSISNGDFNIVGKFGVDTVKNGVCPDGTDYSWKKRRK